MVSETMTAVDSNRIMPGSRAIGILNSSRAGFPARSAAPLEIPVERTEYGVDAKMWWQVNPVDLSALISSIESLLPYNLSGSEAGSRKRGP